MRLNLLTAITLLLAFISLSSCKPANSGKGKMANESDQKKYLEKLGYMKKRTGASEDEQFKTGVSEFQNTWDLPNTGVVDELTQEWMEKDRCGASDSTLIENKQRGNGKGKGQRSKRYAIFEGAWPKTDLTYRIVNTSSIKTSVSASEEQVNTAIANAFAAWSAVTPLTFNRINTKADIEIFFATGTHCEVQDGAFDGPSGTLAHAFSPKATFTDSKGFTYDGDVHFDDAEDWTLDVSTGNVIDVFLVAVHEFGHSLGLGHSDEINAIMYPFYQYNPSFNLDADDIAGIQSLYGIETSTTTTTAPSTTKSTTAAPSTTTSTTATPSTTTSTTAAPSTPTPTTPAPSSSPGTTASTISTASTSSTSSSTTSTISPPSVTPSTATTTSTTTTTSVPSTTTGTTQAPTPSTTTAQPTTNNPSSAPTFCEDTSIDAMVEDRSNYLFVFKGEYYAKVGYYGILSGYPKLIKDDFPELPTNIDAAVYLPTLYRYRCTRYSCGYVLAERKAVYIFKAGTYYKYSQGLLQSRYFVKSGSITDEFGEGLRNVNIDSVSSIFGVRLYFTSGDQYYRVTRGKRTPSVDYNGDAKPLSSLVFGLPSTGIDASFNTVYYDNYYGRYIYVNFYFAGSQYYRATNGNWQVDNATPSYPRPTGYYWFDCELVGAVQQGSTQTKNNNGKGKGKGSLHSDKNKNKKSDFKSLSSVYVTEENEPAKYSLEDAGDLRDF